VNFLHRGCVCYTLHQRGMGRFNSYCRNYDSDLPLYSSRMDASESTVIRHRCNVQWIFEAIFFLVNSRPCESIFEGERIRRRSYTTDEFETALVTRRRCRTLASWLAEIETWAPLFEYTVCNETVYITSNSN